mmetsp:Transcript_22601/g.63451  ORF Transcript_22601/g.63451 Transcript_22601/m.63451 type:complete len:215 (+) Transcript_22601:189-833(+)
MELFRVESLEEASKIVQSLVAPQERERTVIFFDVDKTLVDTVEGKAIPVTPRLKEVVTSLAPLGRLALLTHRSAYVRDGVVAETIGFFEEHGITHFSCEEANIKRVVPFDRSGRDSLQLGDELEGRFAHELVDDVEIALSPTFVFTSSVSKGCVLRYLYNQSTGPLHMVKLHTVVVLDDGESNLRSIKLLLQEFPLRLVLLHIARADLGSDEKD